MARTKEKSDLRPIAWTANDGFLTLQLLDLIQEKENFVVLFGKKDPNDNTSGDHKITVCQRIAQKMFPEDFEKYPTTLGKRVRGKIDDLCKTYKEKAKLLRATGGGVGAPEDENAHEVHHYLNYYIPHDGPHHDTPEAAKNIWEKINRDFKYFEILHKFLSTRPNIVPPVITTGVGPRGRTVVHNQPVESQASQGFDDSLIDPVLFNRTATPPLSLNTLEDLDSSPSRLISTNNRIRMHQTPKTNNVPTSGSKPTKGPKPSTFGMDLTNAVEKARGSLKHIPKKRSLEDVIIESSRENVKIARERAEAQAEHRRQTLLLAQREQLLKMLELGVLTKDEVRAEIVALKAPPVASSSRRTPPRTPHTPRTPRTPRTPHTPRYNRSSPRIRSSPTWEIENSQQSLPFDSAEI